MSPFHNWIMRTIDRVGSWVESAGIDALFFYNRTKKHAYHNFDYYYTNYPVFSVLSDIVSLPIKLVHAILLYRRIEHPDSTVTIYHTNMRKGAPFNKLVETGNIYAQCQSKPFWPGKHTDAEVLSEVESCLSASKTLYSLDEDRDVIVIARQNPWYLVLSPESPIPTVPKKSYVEFFVVQYMNQGTVHLHVPTHMFYVGNELFRPAFVLWLLEQEPLAADYVFDEHYVLTIMDQNIEERHLTSEQYLVLGEDDYTVKRRIS